MSGQLNSAFYTMNARKASGGAAIGSIKFHNGVYITPFDIPWPSQLAQINTFPCFRGGQLRYTWRELEGSAGDYSAGFADIDAKLADLASTDKRMVVFLEHKSINQTDRTLAADVVPNYVKTATYEFGQLLTDSSTPNSGPDGGGKIIKMFNNNIRNRLAVLAAAYGARYNSHPNFEGIGIVESTVPKLLGTAGVDFPADYEDQFAIGLYMWLGALKTAFPNTMVYQFCNYPRPMIRKMINGSTFGSGVGAYTAAGFAQDAIAIGAPNTLINEYGLGGVDSTRNPTTPQPPDVGIYNHFRSNAGVVPIMPSWQRPDFIRTTLNTTNVAGHVPTIQELYDFTKNSLQANYLFITPATPSSSDPIDHWQDVKNWLSANPSISNSITGGLNSAKPSSYESIITS